MTLFRCTEKNGYVVRVYTDWKIQGIWLSRPEQRCAVSMSGMEKHVYELAIHTVWTLAGSIGIDAGSIRYRRWVYTVYRRWVAGSIRYGLRVHICT